MDLAERDQTMPEETKPAAPKFFFLIGPLRTGSSLMARCVDDHPSLICLCESEINRALFGEFIVHHHSRRMEAHGFTLRDVILLINRKKQNDVANLMRWYTEAFKRVRELYQKPDAFMLGDKSPDFARDHEIVERFALACHAIFD